MISQSNENVLSGKAILIVDDEPDVLETIREILEQCHVETAGSFASAQQLLETNTYDLVILDIMGVQGLHLLDAAVRRNFPAVMLTAPALSPEYILESMQRGAVSYLPKEDLAHLDSLLQELFAMLDSGESPWPSTMKRLEPLLDDRFPSDWRSRFPGPSGLSPTGTKSR
jgi:DNA-binding response OmpR family regulator